MTVWVFLLAWLVRLLFVLTTPIQPLTGDATAYDRLARALLDYGGYLSPTLQPTSARPPLYTLLVAASYAVFGRTLLPVFLIQALLDAITCLGVFVLARRHFGRAAGLAAAVLAIFSLSLLSAARLLMTETLMTTLLVLSVWALDEAIQRGRVVFAGVSGMLAGLATLTKATLLPLPGVMALLLWRGSGRAFTRPGVAALALCAGFALTLSPWTIRNYRVHGQFVPVATQAGYVLYLSYRPPDGKIFGMYPVDDITLAANRLPEAEASQRLAAEAIRYAASHPEDLPRLTALKLLFLVSPFDWEILGGDGVFNFTYAFALPFGIAGMWFARRSSYPLRLFGAPIATMLVMSLMLYGSPRLRLPIEPFLLIFAALGLAEVIRRASNRRLVVSGLVVFLSLNVLLYAYSGEVKAASAAALRSLGLW